jgi:hypothetical protein
MDNDRKQAIADNANCDLYNVREYLFHYRHDPAIEAFRARIEKLEEDIAVWAQND